MTTPHNHPLGPNVAAQLEAQRLRDELIPEIVRQNREALDKCTRDTDCRSSLHYPGCLAVS